MKLNIFFVKKPPDFPSIKFKKFLEKEFKNLKKEINIVFVDKEYIRDLNRKYLSRDKCTTVLSFDMGDVAEIYVNCDYNKNNLVYYVLHGFLHILGYEHNTDEEYEEMEAKLEELIDRWKQFS